MWIYLSLLVALFGGVVYVAATNPKYQELGRISSFAGLLAFLINAEKVVGVLTK